MKKVEFVGKGLVSTATAYCLLHPEGLSFIRTENGYVLKCLPIV